MPIFVLNEEIVFPPVNLAIKEGILAVGGDLSPERLLKAYSEGIFPWYSDDEPIVWWSPDPRFVLFPEGIKISRTMRQVISRNIYTITFDRAFSDVIKSCSTIDRAHQYGTWITGEMREAYCRLHELGYAHSVEAWHNGELAGGLYGLSLGRCFFGESMFARKSNASKAAFITLAQKLREMEFIIIDAQVYTKHLESLGAFDMPRDEYCAILRHGLQYETIQGSWGNMIDDCQVDTDGIN